MTGIWLGTLHAGAQELRVQLHLDTAAQPPTASLDSLDQAALGIPCDRVVVTGETLSLEVPPVRGHLKAKLSSDGGTLEGVWSQGGTDLALTLHRQAKAVSMPERVFDPALPVVKLADLHDVLTRDLESTVATGDLSPNTGAGVTVGVLVGRESRVFSFGATNFDTVFEIGSVTKTFTGLLLAQMVAQKKAALDEPVRALLPPGTVPAPSSGAEITLLDLSTQRSGLPRMPDNFAPANPANPYLDYDAHALYAFLAERGVSRPDHPEPMYSNLGVGLLGQALAERSHDTYEALLRREILGPLGLKETTIALTPDLRRRFAKGHDARHQPVRAWDFAALAGAGAIRSTAGDMLVYLDAQLHPRQLPPGARSSPAGRTLPAALALSHELHGDFAAGMRIALGWLYVDKTRTYWHNGGTAGFSAYASFNPDEDWAVVVLCNTSPDAHEMADNLGRHIEARLRGQPAISLGPVAPVSP